MESADPTISSSSPKNILATVNNIKQPIECLREIQRSVWMFKFYQGGKLNRMTSE